MFTFSTSRMHWRQSFGFFGTECAAKAPNKSVKFYQEPRLDCHCRRDFAYVGTDNCYSEVQP